MLRSLIWVLLTLPVGVLILLWVDSHWHQTQVRWRRIEVGVDTGLVGISVRTASSHGDWHLTIGGARGEQWVGGSPSVTGFGYEYEPDGWVGLQIPMWALTLASVLPQLWLLRHQRECRKIGFPVSPAVQKN